MPIATLARALSLDPERLHFAAHSHHLWPDASFDAQMRAWDEANRFADRKWDLVFGEVVPEAQRHVATELNLPSPDTVVFYTYVFWVPLSLVPALFVWVWPAGIAWLWLAATGMFGTLGQLLWTRALRLGEVSALTPISFMQLPLVALFGWWLFDESLDRWTVMGVGIILGSNAYIAHREAVLARRAATQSPTAAAKPGE